MVAAVAVAVVPPKLDLAVLAVQPILVEVETERI
jgi:hypothetical protein